MTLSLATIMVGPHSEMSALEVGIDRFGGIDYNNGAPAESANACSKTCQSDSRCMALALI